MSFNINDINEDLLNATFACMCVEEGDTTYFDRQNGEVFYYIQGYLLSPIGDVVHNKKIFAQKVLNNAPRDYIDDYRYIQLENVSIKEFLDEYRQQVEGRKPFSSFPLFFENKIKQRNISLTRSFDFYFSNLFDELFEAEYKDQAESLHEDPQLIFNKTCQSLALKWIKKEIFNISS